MPGRWYSAFCAGRRTVLQWRRNASDRAHDRITELTGRGLDLVSLWRGTTAIIERVVPHYTGACWFTLDPASLMITSHFNEHMPALPPAALAHEYYEDVVNKLADVARSAQGVSTLHEAMGGDPSSSPRWKANGGLGGDQELILALRSPPARRGANWACTASPETRCSAPRRSASCARSRRRSGRARDAPCCSARPATRRARRRRACSCCPLRGRWSPRRPARRAGSQISPGGDWDAGRLPSAVLAVAGRALRSAEGRDTPGEVALARVLARSGTWVVLHGAALVSDGTRRVAVIVEPAHPARIAPLLMAAYGLSEREQDVTRLVLQGESTTAIADRLAVSPHTVQQHLKSIFDKTGVHSRRDLVGKVFFSLYEPRVRDNESRVRQDRPLRGGPLAPP